MMVLFLCGLVALILVRTIKNDYAKYMRDDDDLDAMDRAAGDDSGWKMVRMQAPARVPVLRTQSDSRRGAAS